jgi:four helix bundle protein
MHFKDLVAYQKAKELNGYCLSIIRNNSGKLPLYYKDQLGRAALSIALNIAEGSGRSTAKDQKHFFVMANGSLREVEALLDMLHLFYKDFNQTLEEINALIEHISKLLRGLIAKNTK